jgi:DNA (cytosine-5)-methyltransferase 1
MNEILTVADFFCGAGGFSEGFYQSGYKVVFGLDNWKPAIETHDLNHPSCSSVCMNILELDTPEKIDKVIPDTDIIVGSPPCVSFSNSNKSGKADKTLGVQLINQYLKIILHKKTKPGSILKYWIMENVPNSLNHVKDIYKATELGLDAALPDLHIPMKHILIASDYGSPQGRKRAIAGDYILPKITHVNGKFTLTQEIMDALGPPLSSSPENVKDPFYNIQLQRHELSDHLYDNEIPNDWVSKAKRLKTDHGYMGKMDFPERTNRLCRTIMATESYCSRESLIFAKEDTPGKYRAPTIRELASLMGFPITYQFTGKSSTTKHKQIGNAVCVHLSLALGNAIKDTLNITLEPLPRELPVLEHNLNDLPNGLFANHVVKPKKINSKFHMHVPNLKIRQLRVELDNMSSDFDNNHFVWKSSLHKGAGKNAMVTSFPNEKITPFLQLDEKWKHMNKWYENNIQSKIYDATHFQEKNCGIENSTYHHSPHEVLTLISEYIQSNVQERTVSFPELDNIFHYKKPNAYSIKILYSLYLTNKIEQALL